VERRELVCPASGAQGALRLCVYAPAAQVPEGTLLVAHGLHPAGPDDPRLDRFLRILAHAGFLVVAPALPDYLRLRCDTRVALDFAQAFDALRALPECPASLPGVLSISFGSYPALRLLADSVRGQQLSGGVVFGGYGDPVRTLRYTLGERGADMPPPDPLSMPAVAINLVDELELAAPVTEPVVAAWLELARRTWGKPELKQPVAHAPIAHTLARNLTADQRTLFLRGCGLTTDAHGYWLAVLARSRRLPGIDARPELHALRRPLYLMHGRDDDVIPSSELDTLAAACPPSFLGARFLTGLYSHTGSSSPAAQLRALPALAREAITLLRMLRALTHVASGVAPRSGDWRA
jgi:pimeloyl-ACP methyl ester carboxylesterase